MSSNDSPALGTRRLAPPPLRGMRAAFVFASRVPLGGFPYRTPDWHWAAAHLPLVGIFVGASAAAVFELARVLELGRLLSATLAVGASVWLTGAFHEDGLADSADGLGGAHGGKRALEIMKDSRIGTYGAAALCLSLLTRVAASSELGPDGWFAFVYVHCLARIGPVWLLATQPRVGEEAGSKSRSLFSTRRVHVSVAVGWGLCCTTLGASLGWLPSPAALLTPLALLSVALAAARYLRAAVGGINGDLLGATEQVGEIVAWISWLAAPALAGALDDY